MEGDETNAQAVAEATADSGTPPASDEQNLNVEGQEGTGAEGTGDQGADGGEGEPQGGYTPPVAAQRTSPYAQGGDETPLFDETLRSELALYLPEETVAKMDASFRKYADGAAKTEAQRYVQAYEQQQAIAQEVGIPAEYLNDVKTYSHKIPEALRGTPQGARLSVLYGIYERAEQEGGDFNAEMSRFVEKAQPPVQKPKPAAQPLSPAARTGAAPVSGRAVVPVGGNGAAVDPVKAHFGWEV